MTPTISHESVSSGSYREMHGGRISGDDKGKTVEQGAEERAKRKMTCDYVNDLHDYNRKRKRKFSGNESSSSFSSSSMSTNFDDYGTDSELIAIDQNKQQKTSCRCVMASVFEDLETDSNNHIVVCSESSYKKSHLQCTQNFSVSADVGVSANKTSTMRVDEIINKITTISKISNSNSCLLDIAVATLKLMKRNREFQLKLTELQSDTTNLLNSVLENPENMSMKERLKFSIL